MFRDDIPPCCPECGCKDEWKERINPFTTGIPLFGGSIRFKLLMTRGFRFRRVKYYCEKCGFEGEYTLP